MRLILTVQKNGYKKATIELSRKVRYSYSTPEEAWFALHTNISAKLKYPLPVCTLTEAKCKTILFPSIKAAFPTPDIASNMNTEVREGPIISHRYGDYSVYHFINTSRISHIVE